MLENLRFHSGEESNDPVFAQQLAELADIYVNDAFSVSHRAHASVEAITQFLPSVAGRLMEEEIKALTQGVELARHPIIALVGGAKVSTKLEVLKNLVHKVDILVPGGGIANTFLLASGVNIGRSLCEPDMLDVVQVIRNEAKKAGCEILLPLDAAVTEELEPNTKHRICQLHDIKDLEMIVDIGPQTIEALKQAVAKAQSLVWNGPLGVFEVPPFDIGTTAIAKFVAQQTRSQQLYSLVGGGDTIAALNHAHCSHDISYISTAGGAFLEWLEGKTLPGIAALESTPAANFPVSKL